jgi:large subunit ribosomal protein L25
MAATLKIEKREGRGKNEARRLRASGRIPAVLYGAEKGKAVEIAVDPKALLRILHSESGVNSLIGLEGLGGAADARVLVKEYQLDPIDHKLLHADFYQVAMDKTITVTVPIVLKGEAKGVKQQGGIVDFVNREVQIEVLPGDIPDDITVDVTELMLNQGIRVRDLLTEAVKWTPISDADMMIVHVVTLKVEEEAPAADAAAAAATPGAPAEPEVIKKGKTDKEKEE